MRSDYLAALDRELARTDPARHAEIKAERAKAEQAPLVEERPAELEPETAVDYRLSYLRGLEQEKSRSDKSRRDEIEAEIARVKAELRSERTSRAVDEPGAENTTNSPARRGRPPRNEE